MVGAPKGNKNALKHGLYAKQVIRGEIVERTAPAAHASLLKAIHYLETVMDELRERLKQAKNTEEYARLANSLALAATALFNGHRTVAYLVGGINPVEDALKELRMLGFTED